VKFDEAALMADAGEERGTRRRIARSLLVDGASTAAILADRLDLTPAAVRRHLDHLLEEGAIEVRANRGPVSRGRGRPARTYVLTEKGREAFEKKYDDLAVQALRFVQEQTGEAGVREFARKRAGFIGDRFAAVRADNPELSNAEILARVFTDEGYAAGVKELPVAEQLCQGHCPVAHVAAEFPQLCEEETNAISEVLGTHVQRLATIAHGDGVCTTVIPHKKEQVG
jgi:predicted ArsR family transcriptional regulator